MTVLWSGFGGFSNRCVSDGDYRFCDGVLYRIKEKDEVPDVLLLYNNHVELLKIVSRQFHSAEEAFAFARRDGELLKKVLGIISDEV